MTTAAWQAAMRKAGLSESCIEYVTAHAGGLEVEVTTAEHVTLDGKAVHDALRRYERQVGR